MSDPVRPRFSIITACRNAEKMIRPTLESVLAQTYDNVQFIVVDGASTDGTLAIIDEYRSRIDILISEPDRSHFDAMNKGIAVATGDYLCFLNAGDSFHQDTTLQRIVDSIPGEVLPEVLYGETALVDEERRFVRMRRHAAPERLDWKSFRWGMLVCHQAFFARRDVVVPYDLGYRLSSDVDWCIRVMKKSRVLHNTHSIVIDYLHEGLTTRNLRAGWVERFRIMADHYGLLGTILFHFWFALRLVLKP